MRSNSSDAGPSRRSLERGIPALHLAASRREGSTPTELAESSDAAGSGARLPPTRVLVAMSGGVDSSVAAGLLQEQGYEVAGVTFKLFCYGETASREKACCGLEGIRDAQATARRLDISHTVLDLEDLFRERVLDDFVAEYSRGRTPNPCVQCNTHVKFAPLLAWARRHGYGRIATGHYVRRREVEVEGVARTLLQRSTDLAKDQSYVLWGVPPEVLPDILFPLGGLTKPQVRQEALRLGLPVWDKEDSQDICFVDGRGYAEVLRERLRPEHPLFTPGVIRDVGGREVGQHRGLAHYTVGQRRGLGLGGETPLHVLSLETATNTITVGGEQELSRGGLWADDLNLHVPVGHLVSDPVEVKIRYRQPPARAHVQLENDRLHVRFELPQRAVAPGQSCVVYRDGVLLAGGRIVGPCGCCQPLVRH